MARADQLDLLKLLLEANDVRDPEWACQKLHEHGVTTITEFAELSADTLYKWDIASDEYDLVGISALPHARTLLVDSPNDLAAIRQELLVRARMHYMYMCILL